MHQDNVADATFTASIKPNLHVQLQLYAPASTMKAVTTAAVTKTSTSAGTSSSSFSATAVEPSVGGSSTGGDGVVEVTVADPLVVVEVRKLPGTNPFVFVNFFRALQTQLTEHQVETLKDINDNIREELEDFGSAGADE